jgi:hypothetical protein
MRPAVFTTILIIFFVAGLKFVTGVDTLLQAYRFAGTTAQQAADAGAAQIRAGNAYRAQQVEGSRALRSANAALPVGTDVKGSCSFTQSGTGITCLVTQTALINTGITTLHISISQSATASSLSFS